MEVFTFGISQLVMSFIGVVIGIIFGALPGMTATMAIAIFLPLTYAYDLTTSLFLLLGLYVGGISGGLIPAILINIPGTPSSICTGFDGFPMAKRGEGLRALRIGITASLIGGLISLVCLWFFTPPLARVAINFSAIEKFLIILFALTIIAALSKGAMIKGIFAGFLGVLVALIGQFADNNKMRMVPDLFKVDLRMGFQLLPVLIGLFALVQIFQEAETGMKEEHQKMDLNHETRGFSFKDFKGQGFNLLRSGLIGTFVGVLPGVGGSAASLLSYSQAKSMSKHPEKFGTGLIDGLIASEGANNGLTGGALIPLLSLGIPGDSTTAVLIGAFMLQGIQVGPLFIMNNPEIWRAILIALGLANILMFVVMFYPIKHIVKVINFPKTRIYPVIILLCTVGSYTTQNGNMFDVWAMVFFGLVGDDLEKYFVDSIKGAGGNLGTFFSRPIGNVIWLLILFSLVYVFYDEYKTKKKAKKEEA
ncbi:MULTISPECIES: tripartite tricarboxylate transporter permease [unclassified Sphaerochaeta]|jgi:putative tricarboxylic transport membrane protein|uniref:tripartite tricarboxylate transporter permease n=1 Tax=unclassified Sphaerochaeta TaxID=2637943 RepID=UPI0025E417C5|nr:tripartite tricarboxylate transporter permease [Sphaerochaeta sp. UBA5856]